jgi:hypothetical protein
LDAVLRRILPVGQGKVKIAQRLWQDGSDNRKRTGGALAREGEAGEAPAEPSFAHAEN